MEHMDRETLVTAVFLLTAATNVITKVVKQITWNKVPTNLVAVLAAEGLTLGAGAAWVQRSGGTFAWYLLAGWAVTGLFVAYAAMFGFDKLRQAFGQGRNEGGEKP